MRNNTRLYLIALLLFISGTGYLLYTGINENKAYHVDVAETLTMPLKDLRSVRVFGTVSSEGIARAADASGVTFLLQDINTPGKTVQVQYKGVIPDGFKPGAELYAEGGCTDGSRVLVARQLTTKCPSKYKKENRT